jgi:hypothetical protein
MKPRQHTLDNSMIQRHTSNRVSNNPSAINNSNINNNTSNINNNHNPINNSQSITNTMTHLPPKTSIPAPINPPMQPVYVINPLYNPFSVPMMPYPLMPQPVYYYQPFARPNSNIPFSTAIVNPKQSSARPISNQPFSTRLNEVPLTLPDSIPPLLPPSKILPVESEKKPEVTKLLYRYQKPITVDSLKHPSDKYKDLIYKPKFITSRNIDPPTEDLIPKIIEEPEDILRPLLSSRREKPKRDFAILSKKPTLVGDLKLPVEKKTPEPVKIKTPEPEPEPEPEPKKPKVEQIKFQVFYSIRQFKLMIFY